MFKVVAELQKANVPTFRAAKSFESDGQTFAPGHVRDPAGAGRAEDRRERRDVSWAFPCTPPIARPPSTASA